MRDAIDHFTADRGRYPESLDELVQRRYLAALPLDPITESTTGWTLQAPPEGERGAVYDLHSAAPGNGLDGTPYAQW